jgi:hypothetical protein
MSFISSMLLTRMAEELTAYFVMFMCANVISIAVRVIIIVRMAATGMHVEIALKKLSRIKAKIKKIKNTKLS